MYSISIDPAIFGYAPGYSRCVFTVKVPPLARAPGELGEALVAQASSIGSCSFIDDRIAEWERIFRSLGINANKYPPSLKSLVKRCRSGNGLPYVNDLVAIMNLSSLLLRQPCGADDLDTVGDDLALRPARGDETFVPLGQVGIVERPEVGEVVYVDNTDNNVLCRRFIWRNGHLTRLTERTTKLAFNVDIATGNSFLVLQARVLIPRLFWDFLGAEARFQLLNAENPGIRLEV